MIERVEVAQMLGDMRHHDEVELPPRQYRGRFGGKPGVHGQATLAGRLGGGGIGVDAFGVGVASPLQGLQQSARTAANVEDARVVPGKPGRQAVGELVQALPIRRVDPPACTGWAAVLGLGPIIGVVRRLGRRGVRVGEIARCAGHQPVAIRKRRAADLGKVYPAQFVRRGVAAQGAGAVAADDHGDVGAQKSTPTKRRIISAV